jgi:hypothetical protein
MYLFIERILLRTFSKVAGMQMPLMEFSPEISRYNLRKEIEKDLFDIEKFLDDPAVEESYEEAWRRMGPEVYKKFYLLGAGLNEDNSDNASIASQETIANTLWTHSELFPVAPSAPKYEMVLPLYFPEELSELRDFFQKEHEQAVQSGQGHLSLPPFPLDMKDINVNICRDVGVCFLSSNAVLSDF